MDFNEVKDSYQEKVEQSVGFSGKGLDFFTSVKADYLRMIIDKDMPGVERPKILDVGCGHGYIHPYLGQFGYEITGVEFAVDVLEVARKENPGIEYIGYNGSKLPFEDHSFDVTLAICVMHHVPPEQWLAFLAEMRRVLRPGGVVVIFEHNPLNPLTRYVVANNEIDDDAVLLSAKTLRTLLHESGFARVKSRNILFTPFANPVFRVIDVKLGWLPFGAQYYAIGRVS
ncbi:class I SAM-dependent methyltransferase [Mariprofundus ferrooxydans]|uniref:class I SAM-dependent methyltransferase n=1 Tax=Mariprofundus ferrooxydans TaxID=314344 RepID=UPI0003741783|nr:class I SAM-dependent methyltransferase [Mariprofundus ferrooxydans]